MSTGLSYVTAGEGAALDARPPVVVAAATAAAHARAARTVEAAGFRVAAIDFDGVLDRLSRQASASALWIELDDDFGADLDRLVDRANAEAASGRFPAIIAAPAALLDPLAARLDAEGSQLLIDADEPARVAALAIATALHSRGEARLNDVTAEPSSARLRQLSDEVGRIAATLARLSSGAGPSVVSTGRPAIADRANLPRVTSEQVRYVIRARRLRSRFFDSELFADPAWDMLLDLLAAEIQQHRVPVSSLCIAAAVPATTALRWIKTLTDNQMFVRRADPHDGRRIFVELSPATSQGMHAYFAEIGDPAMVM